MFEDMKENLSDWSDEEEISRYLRALLHKEAFDHAGLIYGMGMLYIPFQIPVPAFSVLL